MKKIILLITLVLIGCNDNKIVMLQTNSDTIYLESNNSQYNLFEGETNQFSLKPNLMTISSDKDKSIEFVYYGINGLGSTGLRSFGHVIEHDKKSNEFYEMIHISDDSFIIDQIDDDYLKLQYADKVERIELTHIKEKYNSTDLKHRESFKDMITSGVYIIQHNIAIDNKTKKIYVDYDVSNKSYGVYLFTFTIEYSISNDMLDMKLHDVRFLEGEILEFDILTTNEK